MNSQVIKSMMTTPFTVYAQRPTDSMGDRVEAEPVDYLCYVQETMQEIINMNGETEMSNCQLYITGELGVIIEPTSLVTCLTHVKQRIIKRAVYYHKNSRPDVAVLYLP